MISNTTTFGGWALSKASARAGRLLQEFQTNGLLGVPDRNHENIENENIRKKITTPFKAKEKQNAFKIFLKHIVYSSQFSNFLLFVIILNCITIALEVSLPSDQLSFAAYFDNFYLSIYILEFIGKFYVDKWAYFNNGYNRFDFVILLISIVQYILQFLDVNLSNFTFLRVFRSLRALRSFRSIGSIRKLQVIVNALLRTLRKNVLDIIACLFIFMFLFSVMGYYLFGTGENGLPQYFGSLSKGLLTLMSYITVSIFLFNFNLPSILFAYFS
ncbi:Cation channel sperm-associated protein 3 [Coelomomyces lativittatus]|nr:Cation channel sperm-associated protein 3 [Coelomomyces lativittatus]